MAMRYVAGTPSTRDGERVGVRGGCEQVTYQEGAMIWR